MEEKWYEWHKSVLQPLLNHVPNRGLAPELEQLLAHGGTDLALLAADTDRTQEYVFESTKLPEIRGGSDLLQRLNKVRLPEIFQRAGLPAECILYVGGGSLLALVPYSLAAISGGLVQQIEQLYPLETGKATITCRCQQVSPREIIFGLLGSNLTTGQIEALQDRLKPEDAARIAHIYGVEPSEIPRALRQQKHGFGQMVQLMGTLLKQKKDSPSVKPIIEALPFAVRCRMCQIRPAEQMYVYFEDERWPVCHVCRRKTQLQIANDNSPLQVVGSAGGARSQQVHRFLNCLHNKWPELESGYYAGINPDRVYHAQDLAELGAACQARPGYIGFVYADGNRMGRVLEGLNSPRAYHKFSQALEQAIETATYQAMAENLHPTLIERISPTGKSLGRGYVHPLEPLVIGGDDVLLIVPGDAALPIAARLCQIFEREIHSFDLAQYTLSSEPIPKLTLSVGVVIADSHNPVRILRQIAKELCQSAKRRAYDELDLKNCATSALDFLILKSQSMLRRNVEKLRHTPPLYYTDGPNSGRYLTAAPYSLDEFCKLLELLKLARQAEFSVSQLRSVVAALHKGRQYGAVHYMYQLARIDSDPPNKNVLTRLTEIWPYEATKDPIPWHKAPGKKRGEYASIVPDILELFPFVPRFTGLSPATRIAALADLWQEVLQEVPQ